MNLSDGAAFIGHPVEVWVHSTLPTCKAFLVAGRLPAGAKARVVGALLLAAQFGGRGVVLMNRRRVRVLRVLIDPLYGSGACALSSVRIDVTCDDLDDEKRLLLEEWWAQLPADDQGVHPGEEGP